jgi:hypothetical protein
MTHVVVYLRVFIDVSEEHTPPLLLLEDINHYSDHLKSRLGKNTDSELRQETVAYVQYLSITGCHRQSMERERGRLQEDSGKGRFRGSRDILRRNPTRHDTNIYL